MIYKIEDGLIKIIQCRNHYNDKQTTSAAAPLFPYPADHRPAHHPAEPDAVIGEHAGHHYGGAAGSASPSPTTSSFPG